MAEYIRRQVLTDAPDLATATQTDDATSTSAESTEETTAETTAKSDATTGFVATATDAATSVYHPFTDAPTIAGAGIPLVTVPWTAGAPFMQKSSLPEGTVFIAVGAVLAFLGACVLFWRAMVAWSINRSVRRAALASVGGATEKSHTHWGGSTGYRSVSQHKSSLYKDLGSNMSLDQLTSAGKPMGKPHFRESTMQREHTPPADLFFSPTAKVNGNRDSGMTQRASSYMPAGFYSSPNAAAAGGAPNTTLGGDRDSHSIAPYANRGSYIDMNGPSPPPSPGLPASRGSAGYRSSRDTSPAQPGTRTSAFRGASRDGAGALRPPPSREGRRSYLSAEPRTGHSSGLYAQPSSSSLMVGSQSVSDLGASRAPSAYLEDMFENHSSGPRERFE